MYMYIDCFNRPFRSGTMTDKGSRNDKIDILGFNFVIPRKVSKDNSSSFALE